MSEITAKIDEYYASLRFEAESRAERHLRRALADPTFSEAEKAYQSARFALFRAEQTAPEEIAARKRALDDAKARRAAALSELGFSEEDLLPRYRCPHCRDTGFTENGEACSCYRDLAKRLKMEEIGISSVPYRSFDEADPDLTPYIRFGYYKRRYCAPFPDVPISTVFSGYTGTGKTFLASCIAGELSERGFSVFFLSAFSLNRFFMSCFEAESYRSLSMLSDCDLLVIDDLGAEPIYKKITVEYLKIVLDERTSRKKPFLITTNLEKGKILERYGERVYSRIFNGESLDENSLFIGRDLRVRTD